ncbi:Alpha/beta hydrolase fold-3 [Macleaya cordata]|uniref:Alpha/beta hydrolase fold-3 n=1 Tax=Macleaya cordata TaxID=56857 RepID=A0A200QSL2_MACCD|nr:Alpha/beta hydrolase fold-3 [Macleaya cordata]
MSGATNESPILPWKTKILLSILSTLTDLSRRHNGTVNRRFMNFFDITSKIPSKPVHGLKITDITVDPTRNLWFRLYTPTHHDLPNPNSLIPVFIFFHGGGFAFLSPDSKGYDDVCRRFALELSVVVVSVNYRLSPEFKYPSQYDDGFDVLKFLDLKNFKDFPTKADLSRCFLAGDSAGGNIAHHVAVRAAKTDFKELQVIGLVSIQPFFGGEERTESEIKLKKAPLVSLDRTDWLWKVFLPEGSNRDHEAVNVFGPKSTYISGLTKFPATLVVVGGFDPLQDWQKRYYEGLKRCGKEVYLVEYPNAIHAFYIFPELSDSSLLFTEVKNFIEK